MSRRGPLHGPFSRYVWKMARNNMDLVREWISHGGDTDPDNLLFREVLRRVGCLRNHTRKKHATERLCELRDLDAITWLGLLGRRP